MAVVAQAEFEDRPPAHGQNPYTSAQMELVSIFYFIVVAIGFGFVVFVHELGHFLAAKWARVRVEQFAIGFGHALVSFRKGLGFRFGSSGREYEQLLKAEREGIQPADVQAISPTEYRLNWMPLGGYVKMLGQDDPFSKAMIEKQLRNIDQQFDALMQSGIPEDMRAYLGMMGFKVVVNHHGEVLKVDQPGTTGDENGE